MIIPRRCEGSIYVEEHQLLDGTTRKICSGHGDCDLNALNGINNMDHVSDRDSVR